MSDTLTFSTLNNVAAHLRKMLEKKDYFLLFAHNGTGKTRLSMMFREPMPDDDERDTLYFNAFTEDLFTWDNDKRLLRINSDSQFVTGLREQEMESRIRKFLPRYADFTFSIDYEKWTVSFYRNEVDRNDDPIKISRGEERLFIWCFFLAIAELALEENEAYSWVRYLYIDDPISSLDDNNAIALAVGLAQLLQASKSSVKTVISTHHALFFNVMFNELRKREEKESYFMDKRKGSYTLKSTKDSPSFQHVGLLWQLQQAADSGEIYTYHFNALRNILEKTAAFLGYRRFSDCLRQGEDETSRALHTRMVNLLSHGSYSLFEPVEMVEDNKQHFTDILSNLVDDFGFNPEIFRPERGEAPPL
ncbi:MAG: AAA family ATPase [Gammaproteobacteria bacterium]|nr:AAA family ATPase [Gammaproteobacteria bacterium]